MKISQEFEKILMDVLITQHYRALKKLNQGSFSTIYLGEHTETHQQVVIKIELASMTASLLTFEAEYYTILNGGIGIPRKFWSGKKGSQHVLISEKLDSNLEELLQYCDGKFSLKTVLMIADQALRIFQFFHIRHLIHRDVKPENFMMKGKSLYLIDFGFTKEYENHFDFTHIPFKDHKSLTGTARYASMNALRGFEQSRRDDLESLGYMLVYFLKGTLPWNGLRGLTQIKTFQQILRCKEECVPSKLCAKCPPEFEEYFKLVLSLDFEQEPDYATYRNLFLSRFEKENFIYDREYDWEHIEKKSIYSHYSLQLPDIYIPKIAYTQPVSPREERKKGIINNKRLVPDHIKGLYLSPNNKVKLPPITDGLKTHQKSFTVPQSRNGFPV